MTAGFAIGTILMCLGINANVIDTMIIDTGATIIAIRKEWKSINANEKAYLMKSVDLEGMSSEDGIMKKYMDKAGKV
jgi:hypothetical protein